MSSEVHGGLYSWSLPVAATLTLVVVALVYLRGWYRLRNPLLSVLSEWRLAAFMGGLFSLWATVVSPLAVLDHQLLIAHMVKHLLLMTVAAPLILLGAPVITLHHGLPRRFVLGVLTPLVRWRPVVELGHILTHPVFCWLASTATVIGWHVPVLFKLGMQSEGWHEIEQACFFTAGLLFWWPVIRPRPSLARWPEWGIPLYLFVATLPCDALSAFLTFCGRDVYPHYLSAHRLFEISPLEDQACAGALMWVWVTFAYLAPAAAVTMQMLSPQKRALNAEVA
jgi:putative membrane protein